MCKLCVWQNANFAKPYFFTHKYHKIMKQLFLFFCAFSSLGLSAQTSPFQVLAAAGDVIENGNLRMYYTVGEAFIELHDGTGYTWASGFQQPDYNGIVAIHEPGAGAVQVTLFPNPADDLIRWNIEGMKGNEKFAWRLFDATGSFMQQGDVADVGTIRLSQFSPGSYVLIFSDQQGVLLPKRFLIAR